MEVNTGLSEVFDPSTLKKEHPKIVFWNFKNYWGDAIKEVIDLFNNKVRKYVSDNPEPWDNIPYDSIDDVIDKETGKLLDKYSSTNLNVFIAPITWKGLYTDNFEVLGPAFATYGDIKLYNINDKKPIDKSKPVNIAVVDSLSTSTVGLQIILHGICHVTDTKGIFKEPIGRENSKSRLSLIDTIDTNGNECIGAVFNIDEIKEIATHPKFPRLNEILDIDELYSLSKRIAYLPRVAYCIESSQSKNPNLAELKSALVKTLKEEITATVNIKAGSITTHLLAPFEEKNRDAMINFIEDGKKYFYKLNTPGYSTDKLRKNLFPKEIASTKAYE